MPFKSEKIKIRGTKHDRRIKLTEEQRQEIREDSFLSMRALANKYGVSKRLVQFIKYPERLEACKEARQNRGGSRIYYNKAYNTRAIREHRQYKQKLFLTGKIKESMK